MINHETLNRVVNAYIDHLPSHFHKIEDFK